MFEPALPRLIRTLVVALTCTIVLQASLAAAKLVDPVIQHSVFGSGGGLVQGPQGETMHGTVGQALTGRARKDDAVSADGFWYLWAKGPWATSVDDALPELPLVPLVTRLYPNTPNPFNPVTRIRFDLAQEGQVRLELFDLRGRRIAVMLDRWMTAGEHQLVYWPRKLPSGAYFYRLITPDARLARSFVLVR